MNRTSKQLCHLLCALRDWKGNPRPPYNALICMIALGDAGEIGLSARKLAERIGRTPDFISPTLAPWVKAGLVEFQDQGGRRQGLSFYRITAAGKERLVELFREPSTATAAP